MAQKTLLDMVQNILSALDGDEVNSIDDTVESLQVAEIVREVYDNIMAEQWFPMEAIRISLDPFTDTDMPTHFTIPDNTEKVKSIKYDHRLETANPRRYLKVNYLEPEDFSDLVLGRDSTASTVQTVKDSTGTELLIYNDRHPNYWTSFDDEIIIMDSFYSTLDDTLKASKLICYAEKSSILPLEDEAIAPNLPSKAFPYLLAESKSLAFVNIRQQSNPKIEQHARRLRNALVQDKSRVGNLIKYPDYGRK